MLELNTKKVFVSRDVHFHEQQFPFAFDKSYHSLPPIFPSHNSTMDIPESVSYPTSSPQAHAHPDITSPDTETSSPIIPNVSSPTLSSLSSSSSPHINQGRTQRMRHKPSYLEDYCCNNIQLTDVTNACFVHPIQPTTFSFNSLSLSNQHMFHSISDVVKPKSYAHASKHTGWKATMDAELKALALNILQLPPGKTTLPCKWVYKVKHRSVRD